MIKLFAPKQVRCEHCGFEFVMTGFSSAAKIVCLACGQETTLPLSKSAASSRSAARKPEFPGILPHSETEALLCSVENCPLLIDGKSDSAVAEQIKLRLHKKTQRRRTILAWTVTLQICVLLGVVLFVAKPFVLPDEHSSKQPPAPITGIAHVVDVETESDIKNTVVDIVSPVPMIPPPEHVKPSPAALTAKTVQESPSDRQPPTAAEWMPNSTANNAPFTAVVEAKNVMQETFPMHTSPVEAAHDVFMPPTFETVIAAPDAGNTVSGSPPQPEPMTLEMAEMLLESAKTTLTIDPQNSVQQSAHAAKIYEQLGQALPDSLYWIMGNAFALLSWGEPLLESSPAVETMTLSADNRYLLAQLKDKTVWLWDLRSPASERSGYLLDKGTAEYVRFVFSPDLRWIIGGQKNGLIRIWDMSLRNPAETLITFVESVPDLQDLQISPNGQWLVAFGHSSQAVDPPETWQPDQFAVSDSVSHPIRLWNLRPMESGVVPIATPVPPVPPQIQSVRFSPTSNRLAVVGQDAVVRIYDLGAREVSDEPFVLRGHQMSVTQIVFAPCGQWVATGSQDNTVRLWNLTSAKLSPESTTLFGHVGWISALAIDQMGEYVLSGSYDRTIRIWNVQQNRISTLNEQPVVLKTNLGVPESLAITQDGDKMVVLGSEGGLGIYHLPSLLAGDSEDYFKAVTFRNSELSISKSLLTTDDRLLIFSYEHLSNPSNNGIRLWALQTQSLVQ